MATKQETKQALYVALHGAGLTLAHQRAILAAIREARNDVTGGKRNVPVDLEISRKENPTRVVFTLKKRTR